MRQEEFVQALQTLHIALSDTQLLQLQEYAELLKTWNEKMNLTAITEYEEVLEKHFYDCIIPLQNTYVQGSVLDVGSGAGFPGLVWKIMKPELQVTLLEPTGKRCTFLKEVISRLHLENILVVNERAEEFVINYREAFDVVTARAVANLNVLSELCVPLVKVGGYFYALKGAKGKEEELSASKAMTILGMKLKEEEHYTLPSGERVNLIYVKVKSTDKKYPRNYGQIKKKPL